MERRLAAILAADVVGYTRLMGQNEAEVIGEWRFLGLYSSLAYSSRPSDIPILRKKVEHVLNISEKGRVRLKCPNILFVELQISRIFMLFQVGKSSANK